MLGRAHRIVAPLVAALWVASSLASAQEACPADAAADQPGIAAIASVVDGSSSSSSHHHSFWSKALHVTDDVATVAGLALGTAALVGAGGPVLAIGGAAVGGYFAARASWDLMARWRAHRTLDPLHDTGARADWLGLGAGVFGGAALASGARTIGALSVSGALGVSAGAAGLAMLPDGAIGLARNWGRIRTGRRGLAIAQLGLVAVSLGRAHFDPAWSASTADLSSGRIVDSRPNPDAGQFTSRILTLELKDGRSVRGLFKPAAGEKDWMNFRAGTLYRREVAASKVNDLLEFSIVPPVVERDIEGQVGSLQMYVEDAQTAKAAKMHRFVDQARGLDPERQEQIRVLDFLIGNSDRHPQNWLVRPNASGTWDPIAIDHGLTMPTGDWWYHPTSIPTGLSPATIAKIDAVDPRALLSTLLDSGIEPEAAVRVVDRLATVRAANAASGPQPDSRSP